MSWGRLATPLMTPGPPSRHRTTNVRGPTRSVVNSATSRTTSVPPSTSATDPPTITMGPNSRTVITTTLSFRFNPSVTAAPTAASEVDDKRSIEADLKHADVSKNRPRPSAAAASLEGTSFWSKRHAGFHKTSAVALAEQTGDCGEGLSCAVVVEAQALTASRATKNGRNRVRRMMDICKSNLSCLNLSPRNCLGPSGFCQPRLPQDRRRQCG